MCHFRVLKRVIYWEIDNQEKCGTVLRLAFGKSAKSPGFGTSETITLPLDFSVMSGGPNKTRNKGRDEEVRNGLLKSL